MSHLLQRLTVAQMTDPGVLERIRAAAAHYAARNAAFAHALTARGVPCTAGDGLNLWVALPVEARGVAEQLMRRGWLARPGAEFQLADDAASRHLRLTVHDLDDAGAVRLADDVAASVDAVRAVGRAMIDR